MTLKLCHGICNRQMRFFNLDLHQSVIEDVRNVFEQLYGDKVEITNWSISAHNWVFGKSERDVKIINQQTWSRLDERMIREFQELYEEELKTYDGFIVSHTPVFAMLYEKYQKPIVIVNSCRYDQPFCWTKDMYMLQKFHECLDRLQKAKLLYMVSNNAADQHYLKERTQLDSRHIPSLCLYTKATYTPVRPEFVIFSGNRQHIFPQHPRLVQKPAKGYSWQELYEFRGMVHTPYDMSTMSIFEQFWAGVPQFFPTRRFYKELVGQGKMEFISMYDRWGKPYTEQDMDMWLDKADWLALPGLYYYDSFEELLQKIENFEDVHGAMRTRWIANAKPLILEQWKTFLAPIFEIPEQIQQTQYFEMIDGGEGNVYHLFFYMISNFLIADISKPIEYYYPDKSQCRLANECLALLPPNFKRSFVKRNNTSYRTFMHAIPIYRDTALPESYTLIRTLFKPYIHPLIPGKRILIVREKNRSFENCEEVMECMKTHGFEVVRPETMSVREQIQLFSSSEIIVGVHGAALAFTVFCHPQTTVIEIHPESTLEKRHYLHMAHCVGYKFHRFQDVTIVDKTKESMMVNCDLLSRVFKC